MYKFNLKTKFIALMTVSTILCSTADAAALRLADLLLNNQALKSLFLTNGIDAKTTSQVVSNIKTSVKALSFGGEVLEGDKLLKLVKSLPTSGVDTLKKEELISLLLKDKSQMSDLEVKETYNSLIYLANRYGFSNDNVLACSACSSDTLDSYGFKYSLERIANKKSKKILTNLPNNPKALEKLISKRLRKYNSKLNSLKHVSPEDHRSLALFLELEEKGDDSQKALVKAVKKISTRPNGDVVLLDKYNAHKLWNVFSENLSPSKMEGWTKLLDEVYAYSKDKVNKKDTFFSILESRAKGNAELESRVQILKNKNCFFK